VLVIEKISITTAETTTAQSIANTMTNIKEPRFLSITPLPREIIGLPTATFSIYHQVKSITISPYIKKV
jgi:hypothetical protein